jgi:dihydrofolate reductase
MVVSAVVAASENDAIGKENKLLWHLPNDLKFLKNITWGMAVVMGRKSFESIASKPLKGRLNIIITRQKDLSAEGIVVANTIEDAVSIAQQNDFKELMVLGGAEIYRLAMPITGRIYITRVHARFEDADAFFPAIDENEWKMVSNEDFYKDEKHAFDYSFQVWERKNNS